MTIDFKGTPVKYEVCGVGKPVLLLHGFLENSKIWEGVINLLSNHFQVVTIDLLGHGETPSHSETHSMSLFADVVQAVLAALDIKRAAFIGHSMGGYITLAVTEKFPDRVERLLLMDSSPHPDTEARRKERNQVLKIVEKHKKTFVKMGVGNLFAEQSKKKFKPALEKLIAEAMTMTVDGIKAAVRGMRDRKDRTEILKNYKGRKWIIAGQDDGLIPVESLREVAAETGAHLVEVPDGHLSYIEQKNRVEEVVMDFLKED